MFLQLAARLDIMARLFFFLGCLLIISFAPPPLDAQSFRGGIKSGLTASEVSGDRSGGPNKLGWFATVFTDYAISDQSYWHLELMYVQKGSREYVDREDRYRDYTFALHYIEVPILYKFDFSVSGRLPYTRWLSAEMGLSASSVIGHFETNDNGDENTPMMAEERPFNTAELNAIVGVSVPVTQLLSFNFRYSQGITPLRDHASGRKTWYNRGQYSSVWLLGLSATLF